MIIETERTILRPWNDSDAESLFEYASDPRIGPSAGWPIHESVEYTLESIRKYLSGDYTFAITLKGDDKAIGCVNLKFDDDLKSFADENDTEIGCWIGAPFWGQGLVPEAINALLALAFNELKKDNVWYGYFIENDKSKRVQEKLGFKFSHIENNAYAKFLDKHIDEAFSKISREDWLNR
ncbi:GNAT family N-acetyltransferase [Floricoccus penangensis]|uniref:GNAT family N-acetyltransferase n=1 Tax=Floricoccus penangensis TaxID=1859475 RepID=UPI00204221B5|nr:GNAT family N-acetyltransferase [Floricoccus penangensis]URZ87396.1 GNAT family N-acetyltransferase [Floricoccus penangensis]